MSREPSSAAHRYNQARGRSGYVEPTPPTPMPKPGKRKFRVVVSPKRANRLINQTTITEATRGTR